MRLSAMSLTHRRPEKMTTSTAEKAVLDTNNSTVEEIYVEHLNAGIENNADAIQTGIELATLITSKTVPADIVKQTMASILKDTKIKTVIIKPNHVQHLPVFAYIVANVRDASEERISTLLTLATRVSKDKGVKGYKAHIQANSESVKALADATRTVAESQADNARESQADAVAVADITIETVLEAVAVFLKGHKGIVVTDKNLLKGVIGSLIALDK
jgi:hypothetical protein